MLASRARPESSGIPIATAVLVPLVILICGSLLSIGYAYAQVYVPIRGWVTVILLGAYALGLAGIVGQTLRCTHCRNAAYARKMGIAAGLFGIYCSWAAFIYALIGKVQPTADLSLLGVFLRPAGMFDFARQVAETGWFTVSGVTLEGAALWFTWAVEAAVIFLVPTVLTWRYLPDTAYCERCRTWCTREAGLILTGAPATPEDHESVKAGDLDAIWNLPPKSADPAQTRVQIELQSCPKCAETGALQARVLSHTRDDKGKIQVKMTELIPRLAVTRVEREALRKSREPQRSTAGGDSAAR